MGIVERALAHILANLFEYESLNAFFRSPQNTATLIGGMIAVSGGLLGTFLLLRGMSLTSDAISHTVLLGIVVAFMIMAGVGAEPSLSSPWLLIGAAAAGVGTVLLTEVIQRSGLVKQDAALGLAFPLLFAIAVIFVSRYVEDVHLDEDSVMVGEIGIAWADTNSHCFGDCQSVTIEPEDPRATMAKQCTNCRDEGISPRDEGAEFVEICTNCGEYSPAQAYRAGFTVLEPRLVFWPSSVTILGLLFIATAIFVLLFFKELKLSTFDPELAKSLGLKPSILLYVLMSLVSLVAVGAFNAVGSILVIAFFVIPPATAYLITDRLSVMLLLSGTIGTLSSALGYDLARGRVLGFDFASRLPGGWTTSISAAMVVAMFFLFLIATAVSPKYGIVSAMIRRSRQRASFEEQVVLGHVYHHTGLADAPMELTVASLPVHVRWHPSKVDRVLRRLIVRSLVDSDDEGILHLTRRGEQRVDEFWQRNLARE